ncbi:hypothetical protein [uncultured Clostridium sp.]|uniref:hypothetical protein n=1 Tax=uncultured Clostridium sp. TaxID=59620 RepID=UPI0028E95015|nr:hypothetical protein [uncultured Clostridium sp.]
MKDIVTYVIYSNGIKKGKEEQATDTAIKAIERGLENYAITKFTGKEVNMLRRVKGN